MLDLPCIVLDEVLCYLSSTELRLLRGVSKEWHALVLPRAMASLPFAPRGQHETYAVLEKYGGHVKELVMGMAGDWRFPLRDHASHLARLLPNVRAIRTSGSKRLNIDAEGLLHFGLALPKLSHFSAIGLKAEMGGLAPLVRRMASVEMEVCWTMSADEIVGWLNPNITALLVQGTHTLESLTLLLQKLPSLDAIHYRRTPSYAVGSFRREISSSPVITAFGTLFHVSFDMARPGPTTDTPRAWIGRSYKELFAFLKLAFHPRFGTSHVHHLPPIHAIDYTAVGDDYKLDSFVLPRLTDAAHVTLRWSPAIAEPRLPAVTYAATKLVVNGRISPSLFPWLAAHFPRLTSLSLIKPVPHASLPSVTGARLARLLHFSTPAVQFADFYPSLITAAPHLRSITTDDPLPALAREYPAIGFVPYSQS